ncbi:hypothetical protein KFU94_24030 [Chloroflexi bacterium TSY]|nr:hypothetical protein [Chloroflexi bacterium TSY]
MQDDPFSTEAIVTEIREMLKDTIQNELAVIVLNASIAESSTEKSEASAQRIKSSASKIAEVIDSLSEDAIRCWKKRYQ